MRSVFSLLFFAALTAAFSAVGEPDLARFKGKVVSGAEIELTPTQFSRIANYFDVTQLNADKENVPLFTGFVDHYLDSKSEAVLNALPTDLRAELTRGLTLQAEVKLVSPNGDRLGTSPKLIIPGAKESRPPPATAPVRDSNVPTVRTNGGILITEAQAISRDWDTLRERWKARPTQEKFNAMNVDLLPAEVKAQAIVTYMRNHQRVEIPLKENAPPGIRNLLANYNWSVNSRQNLIEFRHTQPYENPAEMEASRAQLAQFTLTSKAFNDLNVPADGGVTYHFHVSTQNPGPPAEFEEFAETYNALLLMRLVENNRAEAALDPNAQVTYSRSILAKGLIRLVSHGRIEQRVHLKEPADSLAELAELMTLPRAQAMEKMRHELKAHVDAGRLAEVEKYSPDSVRRVLKFSYGSGPELNAKRAAYFRERLRTTDDVAQRFKETMVMVELPGRDRDYKTVAAEVLPETQRLLLEGNGKELLLKWMQPAPTDMLQSPDSTPSPTKNVMWYVTDLLTRNAELDPFFRSPEFVSAIAAIAETETGSYNSASGSLLKKLIAVYPETSEVLTARFIAGKTLPYPGLSALFNRRNYGDADFVKAARETMEGDRGMDANRAALQAYGVSQDSQPELEAAYREGLTSLPDMYARPQLHALTTLHSKLGSTATPESYALAAERLGAALDSHSVRLRAAAIDELLTLAELRPSQAHRVYAVLKNVGTNPADAPTILTLTGDKFRKLEPAIKTYLLGAAPDAPLLKVLRGEIRPEFPAAEFSCEFLMEELRRGPQ